MHVFRGFRNQLLSQLIKIERKKLCRFDTKNFFKTLFSEIYIPSFKSFFLILILLGVFFIFAHLRQILALFCLDNFFLPNLGGLSQESNHYQNLIAIHAGIGAIIFALVIFVAESLRDDEAKDRARVLLKESYLFPLAVAEILVFFIFIRGDVNFWSILPVIAIGLFTIWSLSKIVLVLLSKYRFAQKRAELLQERLRQSIDLAIEERIGNNLLLSKLGGNDIKLEYHPFSIDNETEYHCFHAEKTGVISDIDLQALKKLADIVDKGGRKNGFSFGGGKEPQVNVGAESETEETKTKSVPKNNHRYLMKKFHDVVDEEHRTLICLDKKLFKDASKLEEISALANSAFIIKPADNFVEEVRYEISGVKDQFISAIENKRLGKIEELIALYIKLAEGFLEHITKCGGGYSAEQARKERHSLFAGWEQVRWLSSDIRDLFEKAMQSHDREIIRNVAYMPIAIARRAIEKKDHYLFQEFIWFAELLYLFAIKENDRDLRKFLIDRSWRYLKEICDVYVEAKLKKDVLDKEELESLRDFGIHFFVIYQNLLKKAFGNKDIDSFEAFKRASQKLFDHFNPSESVRNVQDIKWRLEKMDLTEEQKGDLNILLEKQETIESIEQDIKIKRSQMFFGLASWILDRFVCNKTDGVIRQFYNSIQSVFPSKIEDFTNIFLKTHNFDVEDFWGWSWWEMHADGEVHSIQILEKLERFYAIKSLSLLSGKTEEEIKKIKLPYSRDLAYLAEGTRDLIRILDDIKASPDNWKFVLNDDAINKVDAFKELLTEAKEAQEQKETELKREQAISQKRVQEFKKEVLKTFYEGANMRNIFANYFKAYEDKTKEKTDKKERFGINIVDDKASFFDEWHIHYVGWGENYGRDLASGENSYLLDDIAKDCKEIKKEEFETTLAKIGNPDNIVIFATNIAFWRFFEDSKKFKPKWHRGIEQLEVKGFGGWYDFNGKSIPVFETYHRKIDKQILILNKSKVGQLVQLSPLNEGEKEESVEGIFYMDIQAFSENKELMEEFIKKPPEWLKKIGDEQKQREHLRERVRIQIFERFEYNKPKDFEGYKLFLKDS